MINKENFDWGCCVPSFIEFNEYEIFDTKIYEKFFEVEKNDIVVDIGASVGPFTYSILNKNPKHCYVVEPMDEQFIFLKKNLEGSPVSFSKLAITDKDSLTISWGGNTCIPRTLKFNEYIKENNLNKIDFLKIDCEGGEYNIFAEPNIDFLLSIPKIVCEFHLDYGENNTNFNFISSANFLPNASQARV
jgi:FkbM family methyltransferase